MKNEEIYSMMGHRNGALDQTAHSIVAFPPLKRQLIGKCEGKTLFIYTRHSGTLPVSNSFIISLHTQAYTHTRTVPSTNPTVIRQLFFICNRYYYVLHMLRFLQLDSKYMKKVFGKKK